MDYSQTAIDWATQRIAQAKVDVRLLRQSVFNLGLNPGSYDLVYDSGCFHYIAPHRRGRYVELVTEARLREIWAAGLPIRSLRRMAKPSAESGLFGEPFLWSLLAQKT